MLTSTTMLRHPRCRLGECPVWCPDTQTLFWADIFECTVYALGAEGRVRFVVDGLGVLGQAPLRFGAGRPLPVEKVVAGG